VVPNQGAGAAAQRIEAVRRLLPKCWFNEMGPLEPVATVSRMNFPKIGRAFMKNPFCSIAPLDFSNAQPSSGCFVRFVVRLCLSALG
jgi:hypothetical protein